MDSNWNAAQSGAATGPSSGVGSDSNANIEWRSQLQPDARQRIVNKIMDTLKRHLPVPVPEGINELQKIAVRFEEKIYSAATSQPDYLRKISLKMLSMENKTQPGLNPSLPNQNRMDPGVGITSQQPSSNPGMTQVMNQPPGSRQQQPLLQGSPNMPTAVGGPSGATITPMSGPSISNSNPMSGPSGTSGPGGPTGSLPTDMYSNTQRRQQPQQLTQQNQMLYHQQQLVMRHKLQQQQQQQQQQQHQQQQQQQQSLLQMSSALSGGSGMMSAVPTGGMQQSQLNSVQQQSVGQGGSFQQQPLMRQQPQPTMQNPTMPMQQTNNVTDLQQQRLQMQQNQMQQSQMQQSQMQQSQMQQNQMQQNQLQPNQMQQNQLQPNQMQQNQMLNQQMMLGQQQNQLLGSSGAGNMNNIPRQMQIQRQAGLLQQQQQPQQQQHLPSQLQSQQQQFPQQQQPNMMQQREMQMPQQRMQGSSALLQTQNSNAIDPQRQQQQQFIPQQQQPQQQQRVLQDVASSPASMDSTAQTGNNHTGDWQEEMYQRLKYLKDAYFADLREIHQKLSIKLSQLDSIVTANARGGEQIEKMKHFKMVLERMMAVLQLGKHNMQIGLKDKLSLYEKQILSILQNHKKTPQQQPQAGAPSDQPHFSGLQQSQPGLQSQQLPQQQQPQQMDSQNQLQQQLNTSAMAQSNNMGMPNAMQQGIQNTLQSDQLQASSTGFGSLQQGAMGSSMQNTMNPPQMVGSGAAIGSSNMSHTVTMSGMQTNMSSAQVLKPQQQHQEQQIQPQQRMMPSQQQMQQRHLQQRLMQQKQQLLQQQLPLQQQKPQQPQQNQMQQLGQPSDPADLKSRQGAASMKPGSMYQQHYPGMGPRNSYYHSQLKPGSNLPISSPQNIQSSSPQISHSSPQVDQQGLIPQTQMKSGTPLQAAASPFIPSPSPPVAPSPLIEDTKLGAGLMHNSAAAQAGQPLPANSAQTGQMGQPQAGSLAVGTPGISASPLLAEFTSPEAGQGTNLSIQVPESEKPIEKLARLMRTMPHNQLSAAVKDIASVVSMVDRIAGSAPGNGSRAAIGDDLVAMTKCRLQAKNLVHPEGVAGTSGGTSPPTKKMKRDTSAMPLISNNNDGLSPDAVSFTDNFKASGPDASEMQSTATSSTKGLKSDMYHALLEELHEINFRLIDTELTLNEEDADSTAESGESILVKCTYKAIALSPGLRAHFTSSQLSPILPLRLLVPAGYPKCSPVILDKLLDEQRDIDDFSTRARSKFNISIRGLSQPMSLKEIAHTWDTCARKVIQEYAAQFGGGSFSSRIIRWQTVNL